LSLSARETLFHAANAALEGTVRASGMAMRDDSGTYWAGRMNDGKLGDRRAGVVWHTQGSGKIYSMLFFCCARGAASFRADWLR
jgi:type I restriction enzyme R subunit